MKVTTELVEPILKANKYPLLVEVICIDDSIHHGISTNDNHVFMFPDNFRDGGFYIVSEHKMVIRPLTKGSKIILEQG